ncbi:hypothetical protein OC844_002438 [Tilletia horrida]|nr:hypothetical protein OC844_002438 [Tilletia horrida]
MARPSARTALTRSWLVLNLVLTSLSLAVLLTAFWSRYLVPSYYHHFPLTASSPSVITPPIMTTHLSLMTWNVRYDGRAQNHNETWPIDTPFHSNHTYPPTYSHGEYPWALRRISLVSTILLHSPAILTLQEVLPTQLHDLRHLLSPSYHAIGVGRNDASGTRGEAVPVFYRADLFDLVPASQGGVGSEGYEHFWLSPSPHIPGSVGWDASQTRICTHLALRLRQATAAPGDDEQQQIIHLFSTHFDDGGVLARAQSAHLIRQRANEAHRSTLRSQAHEPLVLLMGDFNSPREEQAWRSIVAGKYGVPASEADPNSWGLINPSSLPFLDAALSVPTRFPNPLSPYTAPKSPGIVDNLLYRVANRAIPAASPSPARESTDHDGLPFARLPHIVGPRATFTDFTRSTGRREVIDEIDYIFLLNSPAVRDTTHPSIRFPSKPGRFPSPSASELQTEPDAEATLLSLPSSDGNTDGGRGEAGETPFHAHRASTAPVPARAPAEEQEQKHPQERVHPRSWSPLSPPPPSRKWHIAAYGVLPSWSEGEGGVRMSDHRPVLVRIVKA